jgi:hypothetical protein
VSAPTWRALPAWTHPADPVRTSGFRTEWRRVLDGLEEEIERVKGTDVVIGLVVPTDAISWSGSLKAGWKPLHRGAEVSFDRAGKRLAFHASQYPTPRENLHAIALTLEALRSIDRWGASSGEQYAGYAMLPEDTLVERGRALVVAAGGDVRAALKAHHPDVGGTDADAAAINAYAAAAKR